MMMISGAAASSSCARNWLSSRNRRRAPAASGSLSSSTTSEGRAAVLHRHSSPAAAGAYLSGSGRRRGVAFASRSLLGGGAGMTASSSFFSGGSDDPTRSAATVEMPRSFSHIFELALRPEALVLAEPEDFIDSASFAGAGGFGKWQLTVYLGGKSAAQRGQISIFLTLNGSDGVPAAGADVTFTMSACGVTRVGGDVTSAGPLKLGRGQGWSCFMTHAQAADWLRSHDSRMEIKVDIQLTGALQAVCVPSPEDKAFDGPFLLPVTPPPGLSGDLRALLCSGSRADCTLVCAGERFAAHSFILALRSPKLAMLLSAPSPPAFPPPAAAGSAGSLSLPGSGGGSVEDAAPAAPAPAAVAAVAAGGANLLTLTVPQQKIIKPPGLRKLLEYLYTDDQIDFVDAQEARDLLLASDHYDLGVRLRAMCERYLAFKLSVDTAASTLAFADKHKALQLRRAALGFIAANAAAVLSTKGWAQHVMAARPVLAQEVIAAMAGSSTPLALRSPPPADK